jgi:hypothetical protein
MCGADAFDDGAVPFVAIPSLREYSCGSFERTCLCRRAAGAPDISLHQELAHAVGTNTMCDIEEDAVECFQLIPPSLYGYDTPVLAQDLSRNPTAGNINVTARRVAAAERGTLKSKFK